MSAICTDASTLRVDLRHSCRLPISPLRLGLQRLRKKLRQRWDTISRQNEQLQKIAQLKTSIQNLEEIFAFQEAVEKILKTKSARETP